MLWSEHYRYNTFNNFLIRSLADSVTLANIRGRKYKKNKALDMSNNPDSLNLGATKIESSNVK